MKQSMKRRDFVRHSAMAALGTTVPLWKTSRDAGSAWSVRSSPHTSDPASTTTLRDPRVRALAQAAVDAARSAGAAYADVRVTNTLTTDVSANPVSGFNYIVKLGLSVRALVNGYWGWAATYTLSTDEAVRVARLATQLATQSAAHGKPRTVDLGTIPVVQDGDWMTPAKIDPFTLNPLDIRDWLCGVEGQLHDVAAARSADPSMAWIPRTGNDITTFRFQVFFEKQERLLVTTERTLCTQTVIVITPLFPFSYRGADLDVPYFRPVQSGWEYVSNAPIVDLFVNAMDAADAAPPPPPVKPADVGRYDMVFSARAMSKVLEGTFGNATQLDRALGYEANAGGTSYLGPDPLKYLDTLVASPLVSITANRSDPLGLATVQWDEEGVASQDFPLVTDGVLVNYQTTREQAAWLAPYYTRQHRVVQSLGCAMAPSAQAVTMQHTPNLVLHPAAGAVDEAALIQEIDHGVLVHKFELEMDWQCLNGYTYGLQASEIRRGKIIASLAGGALLFRADIFWKDLQALGGATSKAFFPGGSDKGEPVQMTSYSVSAVPARIKQMAFIDPMRKAS